MSRYLTEADVAARLSVHGAFAAVEGAFRRLAASAVVQRPRVQVPFPAGYCAALCAVDAELGLGMVKTYAVVDGRLGEMFVTLTSLRDGRVEAIIEGDLLTALRTGAASGVAAAHLARPAARSVGIIGTGRQAAHQLRAIRQALPDVTTSMAWSRRPELLDRFCADNDAIRARSPQHVAGCDVVVAATLSPTPVIRGEWLRPGALVILIGGDAPEDRELDDLGIQRAALLTCDSVETSRTEAADLRIPVERGLLDWQDVVELQEIVAGSHGGRRDDHDIVVFKSNGLAAWDLALAADLVAARP